MDRLLADMLVVAHAGVVGFIIFGLLLTLLGWWRRWSWVRNFWFRLVHLLAILVVVLQAWFGMACFMTTWENSLRQRAGEAGYQNGFIMDWVHRLLFFTGPPWVFTLAYSLFGAAVVATFIGCRPRWPWRRGRWARVDGDAGSA